MQKVVAYDMTYRYEKTVIPINRIMTDKELKALQRQTASEYGVAQNMVGGVYDNLD